MSKPRMALALCAALMAAGIVPAAAQARDPLTRFLDGVLKRESPEAAPAAEPAPEPPAAPAAPAPRAAAPRQPVAAKPAPAPAASAPARSAPAPVAVAPAPAPSAPPSETASPGAPSPATEMVGLPPSSPLPPKRPQDVAAMPSTGTQTASAVPLAPAPAPVQVAARTAPLPASPEAAIARVNGFFNTIDLMTADFTQESASGQRTEGSLYIKHPGQLRFAYSPPSTLEIVSDGRSVAIRDKKLGTNDVYSANQTPLKFLLQERFDLARDTKVQDVQVRQDGTILVSFEDSATIGGTSKVTLIFDSKANKLKQWVIIDPQGYKTTVALSNVDVTPKGNQAAQ